MITESIALNFKYNPLSKLKPSYISDSPPYSGLRLMAYKSGNKTWIYRYRNKLTGHLKQIKIGSYSSEFNLDHARKQYKKHKSDRDIGLCPASIHKEEKEKAQGLRYTIEIMMEDYFTGHIEVNRNKRSCADFYMICKNTIYPLIGHIPAKYLDIELMTELSKSVETSSRLNSIRVMLGAAFEWGIRIGAIHYSKRKHTYKIKTKFLTNGEYK